MAVNIHKLIAAINPSIYCKNKLVEDESGKEVFLKDLVKQIASEKGYREAADKAEPADANYMDMERADERHGPFDTNAFKSPIEKHTLVIDSFSGSLEPIYFWIIDYLNDVYGKTDKIVDNFVSSSGSGHHGEMLGKATRMQEEAMKIFGLANTVLKSILNIIYDLKEFRMRLDLYDSAKSENPGKKQAALYSLKQVWLDTVDIKRGNSSIKALAVSGANQPNFVTLIDAFMAARNLDDVSKSEKEGGLDLNERVRRLLQQRIEEFQRWLKESEKELRKRYEIEKTYLKTQVSTLKLYARWVKPYLKAARDLEQRATATSSLVTAFNTMLLELTVLGSGKYDVNADVLSGNLPQMYKLPRIKGKLREYYPVVIVEFKFRSVPERSAPQQGYGFRGRLDAIFTSYALNKDEVEMLKKEIEKDDLGDLLGTIEGATDESLAQIQVDLDYFLEGKTPKEEKKEEEDTNPFSALFSLFFKKKEKKEESKEKTKVSGDSEFERPIRNLVIIEARKKCRKFYDTYKKAHSMPAFSTPGV